MSESRCPKDGTNLGRRVAEHYEAQTDEEATEEDESACNNDDTHTSLNVPVDLVGRFAR